MHGHLAQAPSFPRGDHAGILTTNGPLKPRPLTSEAEKSAEKAFWHENYIDYENHI
jgi:hypothetical protein